MAIILDLEKEILKEHSKKQLLKITKYIGKDQERFNELIKLLLNGSYIVSQRSSWAVSYCTERYPNLIKPHLRKVIKNLNNPVHDAVKRNTIRMLQYVEIPNHLLGETADLCFKFLSSRGAPVAVKAFSMTVLCNIAEKEPDLQNELTIAIEDQMPYATPAFISRGQKILAILRKRSANMTIRGGEKL